MRFINGFLLALIMLSSLYLGYGYIQLQGELSKVFESSSEYTLGRADADLTVVDFSKYGCHNCHLLHPVLMEAIKRDGKVRYIPRLVTFERIWGQTLSAATYAAARQGKFFEMREAIFKEWPIKKHEELYVVAKRIGLDTEKLKVDMANKELRDRAHLDDVYFKAWRIERTPTIFIGKEKVFVPGKKLPTVDELLELFESARAG